MRPSVLVSVLGPLQVRVDGRDRELRSPAQRRLLVALVLSAGRTVSLDALTDALWGDEAPASARNSLQSQVARLRAVVGSDAIVTRPPGYALAPEVAVDAHEVERVVQQARPRLGSEPGAVLEDLRWALSAWRGEAYAEHRDDLAAPEAVRLDALRVEAQLLAARASLACDLADDALDTLQRLHADHPSRDDVVAMLAAALGSVGRAPDGLALLRSHRAWLAEHLGLDPGPRALSTERRLLADDREPAATGRSPVGPPPLLGRSVGRDTELRAIVEAVELTPLVTLVGTGGVGKTHLAAACSAHVQDAGDGQVAWVELSAVGRGADVADAVADALGAPSVERTPTATATSLARFPGLVVLDNCEHVLDAVTQLVAASTRVPGRRVRLLATSRERLDLPGERVVRIAPLPVPPPEDARADDPAIALLQDRLVGAGAVPLDVEEAAAVVAAVDGLPLALELAAARIASLSAADVLDRRDRHLDVLRGTDRRTSRHRSLREVIRWSHELLTDRERLLFRRLSVFAASFGLADVEAVCVGGPIDVVEAADGLARLVDRSLVAATPEGRYRLLEPLRRFAAEQLELSPDLAPTQARHRSLCLALARRADDELLTHREAGALEAFERALPDLRLVHGRALADGDLTAVASLAGGLYRAAYLRAQGDVLRWGERLAEPDAHEVDAPLRLRAIAAAVPAAVWRNRTERARELAALLEPALASGTLDAWSEATVVESVADLALMDGALPRAATAYLRGVRLGEELGHVGLAAYARAGLALVHAYAGDTTEARREAERALTDATSAGSDTARALAAYAVGEARADEDPPAALAAYAESAAAARRVHARFLEGIALTAEVASLGRHGPPDEALARTHGAIRLWHDAGADGMATTTLRNLVVLLARVGADEAALVLDAGLARLATSTSYGDEARRHRLAVDAAASRLPTERIVASRTEGERLADLAALVAFALEVTASPRREGTSTSATTATQASRKLPAAP